MKEAVTKIMEAYVRDTPRVAALLVVVVADAVVTSGVLTTKGVGVGIFVTIGTDVNGVVMTNGKVPVPVLVVSVAVALPVVDVTAVVDTESVDLVSVAVVDLVVLESVAGAATTKARRREIVKRRAK